MLERSMFDAWIGVAEQNGRPEKKAMGVVFEDQTLTSVDGRSIYGYRAYSSSAQPETQSAVLVAPGNAMLADQVFEVAAFFAEHEMTAYVFDYRGYGDSEGLPRIKAMIEDYKSIFGSLRSKTKEHVYGYAMSFGGIVELAALSGGTGLDALVIDGTPSALPWVSFCPKWLYPEESIGGAPQRTLVISGSKDEVIPPDETEDLRKKAEQLGMTTKILDGYAHPGMDDAEMEKKRLEIILAFLTQ